MHVLVVGAGMVGLHTAWALAVRGVTVTVLESARGPAQGSSFGTGGYIGPSGLRPFVRPMSFADRTWMRFSATNPTAPLRYSVGERTIWSAFVTQYINNCSKEKAGQIRRSLHELAVLNFQIINDLVSRYEFEDFRSNGLLHLFTDRPQLEKAKLDPSEWVAFDKSVEFLDAQRSHQIEPTLDESARLAGALLAKNDFTINAAYLTRQLAMLCQVSGVDFRYGTTVTGLNFHNGRVSGVVTLGGSLEADTVVLANGNGAIDLIGAARLPIHLPAAQLTACSVSADIGDAPYRTKTSVIDESSGIIMTAMDERIRSVGGAMVGTPTKAELEKEYRRIYDASLKLFGSAAQWRRALYWNGSVMALPDCLPMVGPVPSRGGLFLNVGHGLHGVSTTAATARLVTQSILNEEPDLDMQLFAADRFTDA